MTIIHITELDLEKFLARFPNKKQVVRDALRYYMARKYEGVYFDKEEILQDIKECNDDKTNLKSNIQKIDNKLGELNKMLKEIEDKEQKEKKSMA